MNDPVGTKFIPPKPHQHLVLRQRLIDDLRQAVRSTPVTLITAPAGAGKTTLLVTFTQFPDTLPSVWFSLDQDDNDPVQFTRGFVSAVHGLHAVDSDSIQQALSYVETEPRQAVVLLVNRILAVLPHAFLMILDDLHYISEPSVFALLDYLLAHLPPQMHMLLSGRYEPPLALARLRARRQLTELNLAKLAFTPIETKRFLAQLLPPHKIDAYADAIYQQTDGWAAGIMLLANLIGDEFSIGFQRQAFLNQFGHSTHLIFDYLAEEILNLQRPDVRTFLLDTSIMSEFTVEACQQLTGREDAFVLLDEIYRRNLFLLLFMDVEGKPVYRYHDLFAAFLRERLVLERPLAARELHRRAAEISTRIEARMTHWIAAQEWESAARLISVEGERLIQHGAISALRQWITALPEAIRIQYPTLIYLLGVCATDRWELETATTLLNQAVDLLADNPERQGSALRYLAITLSTSGNIREARNAFEHALRCPIAPYQRAHLLMARVWQAVAAGDEQTVISDLDDVLALIEHDGNEQTIRAVASQYHVQFTFFAGGIDRTRRFCQMAEQFASQPVDMLKAASLNQRAWLHLWNGDLESTLTCANAAGAISERLGAPVWLEINVRILRCIYQTLNGQTSSDRNSFPEFFEWLQLSEISHFNREWLPLFQFIAGRLLWAHGQKTMAVSSGGWPGFEHLSNWIQALLLIDQTDYATAEPMLAEAVTLQRANPALRLAGDARLWLAYLYLEWGQSQAAERSLSSFLDDNDGLAGRIRYEGTRVAVPLLRLAVRRKLHVDFARRTLAMLSPAQLADGSYMVPDTGEILTAREVEVLKLIADGATNPAIAEALTISIHTVKIHVAHLLAKLDVPSRTAAALRARDMGIGSPE